MNIAICDNDAHCRRQTAKIVTDYAAGKELSLSVYSSGAALMEAAQQLGGFDVYIMEVILPEISGIQLGAQLRQVGFGGKILYLTSSREHAIDAFRVHASGYILKPVNKEELLRALEELTSAPLGYREQSIIVKGKEGLVKLRFDSLLYAELATKTIVYHLLGGKTLVTTSIRSSFREAMKELLRDSRFVLCGSGRLVNLHHITELTTEKLIFTDGTALHIGRRASRTLRSVWCDFLSDRNNHIFPKQIS